MKSKSQIVLGELGPHEIKVSTNTKKLAIILNNHEDGKASPPMTIKSQLSFAKSKEGRKSR
jgi:hypothetical protein